MYATCIYFTNEILACQVVQWVMDTTNPILSPDNYQNDLSLQAGNALFRLVRIFSRYPMRDQLMEHTAQSIDLSRILVTEAVAIASEKPEPEVTVGVVAERLDIEPSTASRLVAETISAGYLARMPSLTDSRKIHLQLTDAGRELVVNAHSYQKEVFEFFTHDWTEAEREELARLLIKFVTSVVEIRSRRAEEEIKKPDT